MPEISDSELRMFVRYQNLGTPEEILKRQEDLVKDNGGYRDKIRDLEAKVPSADQVVLPRTEAEYISVLKPLGSPTEIKAKVEKGETAAQELASTKLRLDAVKFAKAAGLADEAVDTLVALPGLQGASFEVRKGKVKDAKGNEVDGDVAYLKLTGEEKFMSFADAKEKLPALKGLQMATPTSTKAPLQIIPQGTEGNGGGSSLYDGIREKVKAKNAPAPDAPKVKSMEERLGLSN